MIDVSKEIKFQTARSGGKGGQNVNKVETMVEGYLHVWNSRLFSDEQKKLISDKLTNKISIEGFLQVKSQAYRTQLSNKEDVVNKMNVLIAGALKTVAKRIATKVSRGRKEKRLEKKKIESAIKENRKKIRFIDHT